MASPVKYTEISNSQMDLELRVLVRSLAEEQSMDVSFSPIKDDSKFEAPSDCDVSENYTEFSDVLADILKDLSSRDDIVDGKTAKSDDLSNTASKTNANNSRKFICSSLSDDQMIIDAGQKKIGPTHCETCGTIYTLGDPSDEKHHDQVHSGLIEKLKMPQWKTERVVGQFPVGYVICVKPGDHGSHWNKVKEVLSVVDKDLGFSEVGIRWPEQTKVYLYIADKKVVGFLLAESITSAFMILPIKGDKEKLYCCTEKSQPVKCGISRIWVLAEYRRKKIATGLVNAMKSSFFLNHYLKDDEFAFSDPTLNGISFASNFMKRNQFLVYNR